MLVDDDRLIHLPVTHERRHTFLLAPLPPQDPDCDRLGLVQGASGKQKPPTPLNRNRLIAMAAAVVLRDHPGATVVTDSVTSEGLTRFIERRGGRHLRYKVRA